MTTKRIIWQHPDGHVFVTIPVEGPLPGELEEEYLDRVALRAQQADPRLALCTRRANVELAALPSRRWRNAWRWLNGTVAVDVAAARQVRKSELTRRRQMLLMSISAALERSQDDGDIAKVVNLRTRRKALRDCDLDSRLDAISDLITLDGLEPDEFKEGE